MNEQNSRLMRPQSRRDHPRLGVTFSRDCLSLTLRPEFSTVRIPMESGRSRMPTRVKFVLLAALLAIVCAFAWAEKIADIRAQGYVTDLAHVIDPSTKAKLETLCAEVQQKTGAQIAVVTVDSLDGES